MSNKKAKKKAPSKKAKKKIAKKKKKTSKKITQKVIKKVKAPKKKKPYGFEDSLYVYRPKSGIWGSNLYLMRGSLESIQKQIIELEDGTVLSEDKAIMLCDEVCDMLNLPRTKEIEKGSLYRYNASMTPTGSGTLKTSVVLEGLV